MAENLIIPVGTDKAGKYEALLPQIKALVKEEEDLIANLANIAAALKYGMGFYWVGFYMVKEDMLVLGPFQGPIACTRIAKGKGVCGKSWSEKRPIIVEDVDKFPGHIACSAESKSEIVLPVLYQTGEVALILDVDSDRAADFDKRDEKYLAQIIKMIEQML